MEDNNTNTTINISEEKSVFERAIIEAFKQKQSKLIYEKLAIALDEIKFMVNEIKKNLNSSNSNILKDSKSQKFLLNKNILDKLSRIIERKYFNVNILIAKIFESLLDPNNFTIFSNDPILLINF